MSENHDPFARQTGHVHAAVASADGPPKLSTTVKRGERAVAEQTKRLERLEVVYVPTDSIKPNQYNPNRQDPQDFELLLRSMREDGFCVEASTPVLCADLIWRPAGELADGQELVAFDEERDQEANYKHGRRFRTATVISNSLFEDELYEVRTEKGEVARCNARHPWLTRRIYGPMEERVHGMWVETQELRPDDVLVKLFDPWEVDLSYDAGWLAGFLDGKGCVSAEATHNGSAIPVVRLSASQKPGWCAEKMISVGSVRPQRLLDNAGRFWEGRSIATKDSGRALASVNKVGRGLLASLATSTKTYIAAGFAVHNTQPIVAQRATNEIVDGEHRWRAARHIGLEKVPVVFVDMTAEQMRISTLRHNRARGSEDVELGAELLRDLRELGALDWAKDSLMIDEEELRMLLDDSKAPEDLAGEEFSPAWLPTKNAAGQEGEREGSVGKEMVAMTPAAKEVHERAAKASSEARTEEERVRIEFGLRADSFRLTIVFKGEEAELVHSVLDPKPADKVLELCRRRLLAQGGQSP